MHISQLYQTVTNAIVQQLEAGVCPWTQPWKTGNGGGILPLNFATRRQYQGINIPILWHQREVFGYPTPEWLTYKQAEALKGQVRKGERGCHVVFTKRLTIKDADTEEDKNVSFLKTFCVFNRAQIDGLTEAHSSEIEPILDYGTDGTMMFINATLADIRIGGDRACYVPSKDLIMLPPEQAFTGREHFLATALHELSHWSGHDKRLNRDLQNRFGSKAYAAEELIAELGAAFLCAHLGITGELRHAEYIQTWIALLRADDRAIFTAASKASQAADYLRSFSEAADEEQEAA